MKTCGNSPPWQPRQRGSHRGQGKICILIHNSQRISFVTVTTGPRAAFSPLLPALKQPGHYPGPLLCEWMGGGKRDKGTESESFEQKKKSKNKSSMLLQTFRSRCSEVILDAFPWPAAGGDDGCVGGLGNCEPLSFLSSELGFCAAGMNGFFRAAVFLNTKSAPVLPRNGQTKLSFFLSFSFSGGHDFHWWSLDESWQTRR